MISTLGRISECAVDSKQAVDAFSALAHENRLAVHRLLVASGPSGLPAGVIAERLDVPPSSLTFHLQHLLRAGLVSQRRLSRQLIYAADFAAMNGVVTYLTENCCGRTCDPAPGCASACAPAPAAEAAPIQRKSA